MKKILSAVLAALMILTFAACDGDDTATTEAKTTDAPAVTTTLAPETTTKAPETTTKAPETTTEAPDVTTNAPAVTTENKVPDTTPTGVDAAKLLATASERADKYNSFVLTSTTKSILEMDGEKTESVEGSVLTIKKVGESYEAVMITTYDGEEDSEAVEGRFYYKDGMLYSDFSDMKLCYELDAKDFLDLAGLQEDTVDYSELFATLKATENADGSTVINATDFTEKGKDYIASITGDLGDAEINYPEFSVEVTVNADGDMTAFSIKLTVEATAEGMTVRMSLEASYAYTNINGVESIDFPSFDDFELLEDME